MNPSHNLLYLLNKHHSPIVAEIGITYCYLYPSQPHQPKNMWRINVTYQTDDHYYTTVITVRRIERNKALTSILYKDMQNLTRQLIPLLIKYRLSVPWVKMDELNEEIIKNSMVEIKW